MGAKSHPAARRAAAAALAVVCAGLVGPARAQTGGPSPSPSPARPAAPRDPFTRGMDLFKAGKLEDSLAAFRLAEVKEPKDPVIQAWIGFVLLRLNRPDDAAKRLNQAIALGSRNPDTYNNLGNALLAKGDLDGAIQAYRSAINLAKDQPGKHADPYYNLGNALVKKGDLDGAVAAFEDAAKQDPDDPTIQNNLGFVYERKHAADPNGTPLTLVIQHYRNAVDKQPSNAAFQRNLGLAARKDPNLQSTAIAALAKAAAIDPTDYASRIAVAELLQTGKQYDRAAKYYREAAIIRPKEFVPVYNLGLLYARQETPDYKLALQQLENAYKLRPTDYRVLSALGWVNMRASRMEDAANWYLKAVEAKPDNQPAHANLGVVLDRLKRRDRAITHWKKAVDLDPSDTDTRVLLAAALRDSGKFEEAVAEYRKVVEANKKDAGSWNNLGYSLEKLNKLEDALTAYKAAIEADPNLAVAYNNLGAVYERQGQKELARQQYQKAQQLDPNFEDAKRNLQRLGAKD